MTEVSSEEIIRKLRDISTNDNSMGLSFSGSFYELLEETQDKLSDLSDRLEPGLFALLCFLKVFFVDKFFENSALREKGVPRERGTFILNVITENVVQLIEDVLDKNGGQIDLMGEIFKQYCGLIIICKSDKDPHDRMRL